MSLVAESHLPRLLPRQANKWHLVVNIGAALVVTALEVALFTLGMGHGAAPPVPNPIAVRVVTLPTATTPAVPIDALPVIETAAPEPAQASQLASPPIDTTPVIETSPPSPSTKPLPAPTETMPTVPSQKPTPPHRETRHVRPASPPREDPSPSSDVAPATIAAPTAPPLPGGGTMGARAIYKPMPDIPEELRDHPMTLVAMARFRVTADGGATVELIVPTANPLLNRALLTALRRWRFFPAMNQGRPVASTIDLRIPVEIR